MSGSAAEFSGVLRRTRQGSRKTGLQVPRQADISFVYSFFYLIIERIRSSLLFNLQIIGDTEYVLYGVGSKLNEIFIHLIRDNSLQRDSPVVDDDMDAREGRDTHIS